MKGESALLGAATGSDPKSPKGQWRRELARQWAILGALMLITLAGVHFLKLFGSLDRLMYDTVLQLTGGKPDSRIVIVAVDDESLSKIGRWPWPRSTHAELLEKLASGKPKAIAFDFALPESDVAKDDERQFFDRLVGMPNVFLPLERQIGDTVGGTNAFANHLPSEVLTVLSGRKGHVQPTVDSDGLVRSAFLKEGGNGKWSTHLMWKMANAGLSTELRMPGERRPSQGAWRHDRGINNYLQRDHLVHFPFAGPPNTYQMVSYSSVLSGTVPVSTFKDKYVLVGATLPGISDQFAVPLSGHEGFMSQVELNANLLDSLLNQSTTVAIPIVLSTGLSLLILGMVLVCIPKREELSVIVGLLSTLVLSTTLLLHAGLWFAPTALMAMIGLAYPIWDWRRLLSVRKLLASELQLFQSEHDGLNRLPMDNKQSTAATILDQMDLLVWARAEIANSQRQRKNTIELLGHDIRGPQVAIMGLLDLQSFPNKALPPNQLYQAIRFQSKRSLSLLDDLMQLVNAESGTVKKVSHAMADALQEAVDQCWALAKAREVNLVQRVMATETWVQMDPVMINRALVNLINNAINYSNPGSTVKCTLWRVEENQNSPRSASNGPRILVSISDQGCGIAPENLPHLYQWRKRFNAHEEGRPAGFGLGLAFVKAAIDSHGGRIRCKSAVGVGTTFIVSLAADTSDSIWGPEILNPSYLEEQDNSSSPSA